MTNEEMILDMMMSVVEKQRAIKSDDKKIVDFLRNVVRRELIPGCRIDSILVLSGPESIERKTELARTVAVEDKWYHKLTLAQLNSKMLPDMLRNRSVVEVETDRPLTRKEIDIMLRPSDYARGKQIKRTCVFIVTTDTPVFDEPGLETVYIAEQPSISWLRDNIRLIYEQIAHEYRQRTKGN